MSAVEDETEEADSPLEAAVAGVVTTLTLLVAFGLLAVGYPFFWVVFIVGFAGILPTALALASYYQEQDATSADDAEERSDTEDALETLRERYARGELTETEFETRLETLLETESVDEARAYAAGERIRGANSTYGEMHNDAEFETE